MSTPDEHGTAGQAAVVHAARARQEITVEQAAIRSGRSASEFAAIEGGRLELDADELRDVLLVLGEELIAGAGGLSTRPLQGTHDPEQLAQMLEHPPNWRLAHALDWNEFASDLYRAGRAARGD